MRLKVSQQLNQIQTIKFNQSMIHDLKILEMDAFNLEKLINNEIESNPILNLNYNYRIKKDYDFSNIASETSILEDLMYQLNTSNINNKIGTYILNSLDDNGYFSIDINESIEILKCSIKEFNKTLTSIQNLEPKGIASRNLKEYLLIQAIDKRNLLLVEAIKNIELFAQGKFERLSKELNVSRDKVNELFKEIKNLNPYPINNIRSNNTILLPDIHIEIEDDKVIFMVEDYSKLILIDEDTTYEDKEANKYINEKRAQAKSLQRSTHRRTLTLIKIIKAILDIQNDYFFTGKLKTLTLKMISEITEFNISTISRAIKNKGYTFNNCIYPISNLFDVNVNSNSKKQILKLIKDLINNEDKNNPLSDLDISKLLLKDNINISRRAISKYRNNLRILSSSKRKAIYSDILP